VDDSAPKARRAPSWSIAATDAPLALYLHSGGVTTTAQGGSLATHNPGCAAKSRPDYGIDVVSFL